MKKKLIAVLISTICCHTSFSYGIESKYFKGKIDFPEGYSSDLHDEIVKQIDLDYETLRKKSWTARSYPILSYWATSLRLRPVWNHAFPLDNEYGSFYIDDYTQKLYFETHGKDDGTVMVPTGIDEGIDNIHMKDLLKQDIIKSFKELGDGPLYLLSCFSDHKEDVQNIIENPFNAAGILHVLINQVEGEMVVTYTIFYRKNN